MADIPKILVVEDEVMVAQDIQKRLYHLGYEVAGMFVTGEEAVAQVKDANPDIILMDIKLAGVMDGIEAAEQIRSQVDIPIIYLTAHSDKQIIERAKATDPYGYVLKPIDIRDLEVTIEITLQKHASDKAIKECERFKRAVLNAVPEHIAVLDGDGKIISINQAWNNFAQENQGSLEAVGVGVNYLEICRTSYHSGSCDAALTALDGIQSVMQGESNLFELEYPCKTPQKELWFIMRVTPLPKNIAGWVVVSHTDITHRIQVEKAQQQALEAITRSQRETEVLLDAARTILMNHPFETTARSIFDMCKDLLGATSGYVALLTPDGTENEVLFLEAGGLPCSVNPELPMPIRGLRAEAYHTGKTVYHNDFFKSEWRNFLPPGHVRLDNVLFAPLVIRGKTLGLLGLANKPEGFTENDAQQASAFGELAAIALNNSRTNEALSYSEECFRSIAETAIDSIIATNSQGNMILWNNAAERLFGYQAREMINQPLKLIIPERFWQAHQQGMTSLMQGNSLKLIGKIFEVTGLRKDASEVPLELSLAKWEIKGEVFFTGIMRDLSERKRASEEKGLLEAQLGQAQKMEAIGTLAGGIAHDFNNILWAIMGFTELTLNSIPNGSREYHHLQQVLKASERAKDLVNQILAFSRKSGQERKPLQIDLIVKEAMKLLRATIPTTIEIQQNITSPNAMVLADPTQIHQLIMNLCTNSAHAMREKGGILEIRLEEKYLEQESLLPYPDLSPGPFVILTVSDTGHGISPEYLDRIFEPFFTTKEVGVGTGMGLAVVYGIVKSHAGGITVNSRSGEGTTFTVFLPKIININAEVKAAPAPIPMGRGRILVIDDEEVLIELNKEMLESLGYEVVIHRSSIEALKIFQAQSDEFELVITDQTMPHMTGMQLAQELRRLRPNIPIILCTGYSDTISEETVKASGINELLMKPINLRKLAETVCKVLDKENFNCRSLDRPAAAGPKLWD